MNMVGLHAELNHPEPTELGLDEYATNFCKYHLPSQTWHPRPNTHRHMNRAARVLARPRRMPYTGVRMGLAPRSPT
jgi:hypothetical protein